MLCNLRVNLDSALPRQAAPKMPRTAMDAKRSCAKSPPFLRVVRRVVSELRAHHLLLVGTTQFPPPISGIDPERSCKKSGATEEELEENISRLLRFLHHSSDDPISCPDFTTESDSRRTKRIGLRQGLTAIDVVGNGKYPGTQAYRADERCQISDQCRTN